MSATGFRQINLRDKGTETDGPYEATAVANAATYNKAGGKIVSSVANLAAGAGNTITVTNSKVKSANARIHATLEYAGDGQPVLGPIVPSAGQFTVEVYNVAASDALNGTFKVVFDILNEG